MNQIEIDKRLAEIEQEIKNLQEEAVNLRAQKRNLLRRKNEDDTIALIYKLQAEWSINRPKPVVKTYPNWTRIRGGVSIYSQQEPQLVVMGDFEEMFSGKQKSKLRLVLSVRPSIGVKPYAKITRTFSELDDMKRELPELAYVVISAAAKKVANN